MTLIHFSEGPHCLYVLHFLGKGGGVGEVNQRGAIVHKAGSKKLTRLTLSPVDSINSIKHQ
jgi:hypothetical protein